MALVDRLAAGGTRGLGCANAVAAEALRKPELVGELVESLGDEREVVTRRAANALRKVQQGRPSLVAPYAKRVLRVAVDCATLLTKWNLTIVLGRMPLKGRDKALAIDLMFEALASESGIQRAFAMTALAEYAREDEAMRLRVRAIVERALDDRSAAMRARARKLTKQL